MTITEAVFTNAATVARQTRHGDRENYLLQIDMLHQHDLEPAKTE